MHRYTQRGIKQKACVRRDGGGVWPGAERGRRSVCACIKIGDFLVRVAGLGISLGSD